MEKKIEILNESGLHARPAGLLIKTLNKFKSNIDIIHNGVILNGKSIMSILSAGIKKGDILKISVDGEDAEEAVKAFVELAEAKFGEA